MAVASDDSDEASAVRPMHAASGARQHVCMAPKGFEEQQMHKPARHVVMSFVSADDATVAVLLLLQLGLASSAVCGFTPAQMRAKVALTLSPVYPPAPAPPGPECELLATQRELARHGHSFVLVRASSQAQLKHICRIAAEAHAMTVRTSTVRATLAAPARPAGRHRPAWSEELHHEPIVSRPLPSGSTVTAVVGPDSRHAT
jgi:hypothetical protein